MNPTVKLKIIEGHDRGKEFKFEQLGIFTVGRSPDCNLAFPDESAYKNISRNHCLIEINPPSIAVKDLGSVQGTLVNGQSIGKRLPGQTPEEAAQQLKAYILKDGDRIQVGNTILAVEIISETQKTVTAIGQPQPNQPQTHQPQPNQRQIVPVSSLQGLFQWVRNLMQKPEELPILEGYALEQKLGQGGFGEVYLAKHLKSKEKVAVKVMIPQVQETPRMRGKFNREIEICKALDHQNIVQLKDYGFSNGLCFLTLEYCAGGTVEDLMTQAEQKRPLDLETALNITLQLLDALDYAHNVELPQVTLGFGQKPQKAKGVVHRDIKPSNIFLTSKKGKPQIKLGDFGIAKAFDLAGYSGLSLTGKHLEGSFDFMSRQQVINFGKVKPEVDVWAAAACLYYFLTARTPRKFFSGDDLLLKLLQSDPTPIEQYNPHLPKQLAELINVALVDHPTITFKNARAFKNALERII